MGVVRCILTNLLGTTKEVNMILSTTATGNDDDSEDNVSPNASDALLPALVDICGWRAPAYDCFACIP